MQMHPPLNWYLIQQAKFRVSALPGLPTEDSKFSKESIKTWNQLISYISCQFAGTNHECSSHANTLGGTNQLPFKQYHSQQLWDSL